MAADHDHHVHLWRHHFHGILSVLGRIADVRLLGRSNIREALLQRQIDTIDKQIDQLVYKLYDLTNEEIRIVEEATDGGLA